MNQIAAIALFAAGLLLLAWGINVFNSADLDFAGLLTGAPTAKSLWLLIGGGMVAAAGVGGCLRGVKA